MIPFRHSAFGLFEFSPAKGQPGDKMWLLYPPSENGSASFQSGSVDEQDLATARGSEAPEGAQGGQTLDDLNVSTYEQLFQRALSYNWNAQDESGFQAAFQNLMKATRELRSLGLPVIVGLVSENPQDTPELPPILARAWR